MLTKRSPLLDQWIKILCPHIDTSELKNQHSKVAPYNDPWEEQSNLFLTVIQSHLQMMNSWNKEKIDSGEEQTRAFDITLEEM